MTQMHLPFMNEAGSSSQIETVREEYITGNATSCDERVALEIKYADLFHYTNGFNRKLVSYQGNKDAKLHNWLKYKEGFSAQLVNSLLDDFGLDVGQKVLDPFAGSATTLLVAQARGLDAIGVEILPICHLAWEAKSNYPNYNIADLEQVQNWLQTTLPNLSDHHFPHIPITESAFPDDQERKLMWYVEHVDQVTTDEKVKKLLRLALMSILEDISFTRKDGQYLRWDSRSSKAQLRDRRRIEAEKAPYKPFSKGELQDVSQALIDAFNHILVDIKSMQKEMNAAAEQRLIKGSVLTALPALEAAQFDTVITSPPYCNRYDYTRTYALELAFLGLSHQDVIDLRQEQLSCTVENRSKLDQLQTTYRELGRERDFGLIVSEINSSRGLQEVFEALETCGKAGHLNNKGVIQMVKGYFTELAFVIFELFRVTRAGGSVAIVNDNVRYAGEIIPVDLLLTDLATAFGFQPQVIYVLPQRKGNSSQQMGKFGREALRKSILVWKKPSRS